MSSLGAFDLFVGLLSLVFLLYGLVKGMARLILGFLGIAAGWVLALRYSEGLSLLFGARSRMAAAAGPDIRRIAAFSLIFVATVILACVLGWAATKGLSAAKLGGVNRFAGACLGLFLAVILACACTVPLMALWPPDGGPLMRGSLLAPYAVEGGDYLKVAAPDPIRARFSAARETLLGFEPEVTGPKPERAPRPR